MLMWLKQQSKPPLWQMLVASPAAVSLHPDFVRVILSYKIIQPNKWDFASPLPLDSQERRAQCTANGKSFTLCSTSPNKSFSTTIMILWVPLLLLVYLYNNPLQLPLLSLGGIGNTNVLPLSFVCMVNCVHFGKAARNSFFFFEIIHYVVVN